MKFLVTNYSCLQNPWLGGTVPRSTFSLSSVLNWICWPPPEKKFLGTPLHWPKQWHSWRQVTSLQFSRLVGSFCCVVSGAPWTRLTDCQKTNCFSDFFVLSSLYHALHSFSHGWTDIVGIDLPSEVPTPQSIGPPLDEWSVRRRDLYLTVTAHNTRTRRKSTSPVGFEPPDPASGQSQIHALDRAATAIGHLPCYVMGYWRYVTTCYCQSVFALTVRVHISTPATDSLVCSGLLGIEGERTTTRWWRRLGSSTQWHYGGPRYVFQHKQTFGTARLRK